MIKKPYSKQNCYNDNDRQEKYIVNAVISISKQMSLVIFKCNFFSKSLTK